EAAAASQPDRAARRPDAGQRLHARAAPDLRERQRAREDRARAGAWQEALRPAPRDRRAGRPPGARPRARGGREAGLGCSRQRGMDRAFLVLFGLRWLLPAWFWRRWLTGDFSVTAEPSF